ncbi:MAG: hypothetical protein CVV18_03925 [Gammaproteobacteria bacterium HGW-Gammaproteobacteria-8]|nr:MAG: hypothetical protein CVV18_03925 [Gammaproteobacteria bacterium HGW-Gammaproteobacteria-8]
MNSTRNNNRGEHQAAQQRVILVLGPGRSGTSTLTRALDALGIYLGTDFRRPVRKNPRGNQEEVHLLTLSKKIRNSVGLRADSVRLIDDSAFDNPRTQALTERMEQAIRRYFGHAPVWAFKYAGTGRLLPVWFALLQRMNIEPAFVFAYRNPLSVARSRARLDRARGRPEQNNLEWLAHVVPCFNRLEGQPVVVVDYDRLLDQPDRELRRIAAGLNLSIDTATEQRMRQFGEEFLRSDWRHTCFDDADLNNDTSLHPLVRSSALLLSRLASDHARLDDPRVWEEWRAIDELHREQAPVLRLVDQLNADNRRGRWWDLRRPLKLAWNKMPLLRIR